VEIDSSKLEIVTQNTSKTIKLNRTIYKLPEKSNYNLEKEETKTETKFSTESEKFI
jgi:hypothetical protein